MKYEIDVEGICGKGELLSWRWRWDVAICSCCCREIGVEEERPDEEGRRGRVGCLALLFLSFLLSKAAYSNSAVSHDLIINHFRQLEEGKL